MHGTDQLSAVFAALADPTRRAILAELADHDATVTERKAHSLKGSSSMMGAHLVQKTSQAIEQAASEGDLASARALLPMLVRVHEATLERLLAARNAPAP